MPQCRGVAGTEVAPSQAWYPDQNHGLGGEGDWLGIGIGSTRARHRQQNARHRGSERAHHRFSRSARRIAAATLATANRSDGLVGNGIVNL
jgi:hypothetical protein